MSEMHHLFRRYFSNVIDCHIRRGIAHGLGSQPILTVTAMEIATEHPKRQRVGAGHHVEERFLLDGIAL
jgi:hypothetical protein